MTSPAEAEVPGILRMGSAVNGAPAGEAEVPEREGDHKHESEP